MDHTIDSDTFRVSTEIRVDWKTRSIFKLPIRIKGNL